MTEDHQQHTGHDRATCPQCMENSEKMREAAGENVAEYMEATSGATLGATKAMRKWVDGLAKRDPVEVFLAVGEIAANFRTMKQAFDIAYAQDIADGDAEILSALINSLDLSPEDLDALSRSGFIELSVVHIVVPDQGDPNEN